MYKPIIGSMANPETKVEARLRELKSLRDRHGLRAETLLPDLALVGLLDDIVDAAETALELLATERPYRAYSMVRVAFEAAQRLLVLGTADDYIAIGTRAWLYYQAKDAALRGSEEAEFLQRTEDQFVGIWQSRYDKATKVAADQRQQLAQRKRGAPDNFLGENLGQAVHYAYERIAAKSGTIVPPDSINTNSALYRSLCRDTHACMRIDPVSVSVGSEGYVSIVSSARDKAKIKFAVCTGLETCLREAITAISFRLHERQLSLAAEVRENINKARPTTRPDYRPDFGRHVLSLGVGPTTMVFPGIPVKILHGLADGTLSCSVTTTIDGAEYVATFDFRGDPRTKILKLIKEKYPDRAPHSKAVSLGGSIDLPEPLLCTITALLGKMQSTEHESFVPLVVVDITPLSTA